jgi:hypothetical protein
MNIKKIIEPGLTFCGEVPAVRQTYYVFEALDYYFMLSFSRSRTKPDSGYFNLVNKKTVAYIKKKFRGYTDVTANEVVDSSKRTKHIPTALVALNVLYVLVSLGEAEIVDKGSHQQLYFYVKE